MSVLDYHPNSLCPLSADQSIFTGDTLLAIRAPSGTRLEVPIPEVSDKCVGRVQECVCVCVCVCVCRGRGCCWIDQAGSWESGV